MKNEAQENEECRWVVLSSGREGLKLWRRRIREIVVVLEIDKDRET